MAYSHQYTRYQDLYPTFKIVDKLVAPSIMVYVTLAEFPICITAFMYCIEIKLSWFTSHCNLRFLITKWIQTSAQIVDLLTIRPGISLMYK